MRGPAHLQALLARFAPHRHSLRTRLMLWNMVILALLLGVLGLVTRALVRSLMIGSVDRELLRHTQTLADLPPLPPPPEGGTGGPWPEGPGPERPPWAGGSAPGPPGPAGPPPRPSPRVPPSPFRFLDLRGRVVAPPGENGPFDRAAFRRAAKGELVLSTVVRSGTTLRVVSRLLPDRGLGKAVVQEAYPLTEVNRALAGLGRALLALAPLALLFAAAAGALLTQRVLHPVRRMAQAAGRIGAEDLSHRLPITGKDEFSELGATFNGMLQRLEEAFREKERLIEQQRRFTADASHELRTPLGIIKANTSLCLQGRTTEEEYRQSLLDIDRAASAMTRLVLDLLLLARSDAGHLARNPITLPIGEVLQRAVAALPRDWRAAVCLNLPEAPLCVVGNEDELVRLFTNLLENAVNHTPTGGSITLSAELEGEFVHVALADTGEGIAPEHLAHLGERFYRVDTARSRAEGGAGLGLSICKSIVEAHGGRLTFESTVGVGTVVHVALPIARSRSRAPGLLRRGRRSPP